MKIWKEFFAAAKGHEVSLIIPGVWNENDPLRLAVDNWRLTDEALIYDAEGDTCWVLLDAIKYGRIRVPEPE